MIRTLTRTVSRNATTQRDVTRDRCGPRRIAACP